MGCRIFKGFNEAWVKISLSKPVGFNSRQLKDIRAAGELEGQRSIGAGVNDMPAACQSRAVTEPQRDFS